MPELSPEQLPAGKIHTIPIRYPYAGERAFSIGTIEIKYTQETFFVNFVSVVLLRGSIT